MPRVTLPFNGEAGTTLTTQYFVTLVGSGQILNDANAGTYATYSGGGGNIFSSLPVASPPVPDAAGYPYMVEFALKTSLATTDEFNVYIIQSGTGTLAKWQSFAGQTCAVVDGWLRGTLILVEPVLLAQALSGATAPTGQIELLGSAVTVAEAKFIVTWGGFDAPPCRNIKRGDRLDLGGARNYPPSKMQQTSSRGVGAY